MLDPLLTETKTDMVNIFEQSNGFGYTLVKFEGLTATVEFYAGGAKIFTMDVIQDDSADDAKNFKAEYATLYGAKAPARRRLRKLRKNKF